MEVSQTLRLAVINEIKILSNVRLINQNKASLFSRENLQVQFTLSGDLIGHITCFLCLDGHELAQSDKNFIFPLFVESMNILVGRQISTDKQLKLFHVKLSPPKLSMLSQDLNLKLIKDFQGYQLEIDGFTFNILSHYDLGVLS